MRVKGKADSCALSGGSLLALAQPACAVLLGVARQLLCVIERAENGLDFDCNKHREREGDHLRTGLRRQDSGGWIHVFSRSVIEIQPDFH